ncbi:MAG: hypothetical protein Q7U04_17285, partial [Bacteriovorax sp.]|nr:hypothetical protein [Bacteriovorax sp.]
MNFEIQKIIKDGDLLSVAELQKLTLIPAIDQEIRTNIEGLDSILKLKIFSLSGKIVFSTDRSQLGQIKDPRYSGLSVVRTGRMISNIEFEEKINTMRGDKYNIYVLSSYLPLRDPKSDKIIGLIEVYSDLTSAMARISQNANLLTMISLLLFGLILVVIFFILRKAEKIALGQAITIQENQTRLIATSKLA